MTRRFELPALAVVKIGSNSLRDDRGRLDRDQIADLADQVARARLAGTRVVIVSSGAVAAGMGLLGMAARPTDLPTLQAAAAAGQGDLVHEWQARLADHGLVGAQILLTQDDFVHRPRYLNARTTLQRLLELGCVPVINENDAIATEELALAYGDNDHLAALVASMLEAPLLLLLSDVDGLYDADPRSNPAATRYDVVADLDALDRGRIGGTGSAVSRGGMRTKVDAAHVAVASGTQAIVADARRPDVLAAAIGGDQVGTWFVAGERRRDARRLWIAFALQPKGRIVVDAGAAAALRDRGVSLLGVGVVRAEGGFVEGDAVEVVDEQGRVLGRGLSAYAVADVTRLAGLSTQRAAADLGMAFAREVVHRDDLALLPR